MPSHATFRFDNSFARELPGLYVPWRPAAVSAPRLLYLNRSLAAELGLDVASLDGPAGAATFSGNVLPEGAEPLAQAYAGHQFGGFSPQLGDGRALLLGEVIDRQGRRRDIALKGSGRTPFARGGDGKAAVGPMLREVLLGEAMHALGIPTTRALAVVATAAQPFLALLQSVSERQSTLVAQWMNVGFIHGVMNTDNMAISGETIDYGPCAFVEAYDPAAVFSSIDHRGRYAFGNQPAIAGWNLTRLAETLLPLLADDPEQALTMATEVVAAFPARYRAHLLRGQRAKLGLRRGEPDDDAADAALAEDWLTLLHAERVDFTLGWRRLAAAAAGDEAPLRALFAGTGAPDAWLARWRARCASEGDGAGQASTTAGIARAQAMRSVNPVVIPRNHRVEEALAAASDEGDLAPFEKLLDALTQPFDEAGERASYAEPAPAAVTASYRTFCGT